MRFGFRLGEEEMVIYCETSADITVIETDSEERIYKIGDAEIHYKDDICFVSHGKRINLSETGSDAFVINSDGELLYQMVKPEKEISETVFATPSGKSITVIFTVQAEQLSKQMQRRRKNSEENHAVSAINKNKSHRAFIVSVG